MKFENCKAASSEIQVEGMRSVTSVRDAANRLSRTKYMASEVIVKYNDLFNMQIGNLLGGNFGHIAGKLCNAPKGEQCTS